jgi:hypothetical protein
MHRSWTLSNIEFIHLYVLSLLIFFLTKKYKNKYMLYVNIINANFTKHNYEQLPSYFYQTTMLIHDH